MLQEKNVHLLRLLDGTHWITIYGIAVYSYFCSPNLFYNDPVLI